MSSIIPFDFNDRQVRIIDQDGEPWFVAKDVAEVLGYTDAQAMTRRLDEDEVQNRQIVGSGFNNRGINLINEAGLYSVILTSQKAEAKQFKRWITHEVLPSIRQTGGYAATPPAANDGWIFELAVDALRPDPTSKLAMLKKFGETRGQDMQFLPDYSESSGVHHSLSELLKRHKSDLSARKANQLLVELGYLEVRTRQSKTRGSKQFKSVTEKGAPYGCNLVSPSNPNETQAHWYDDHFRELLGKLESAACAA